MAFHTSCLPQHCGRSVPGKRIICPKHALDDDNGDTAPTESRKTETEAAALALSSSGASSSSSAKRLAKSLKREKKKKKKSKRKKEKKRRDRSSAALDSETTPATASGRDDATSQLGEDDIAPRSSSDRESIELPALTIPEAVSPATSSSLFESPATSNERIKARLVEALGQSDDDVESSVGSPQPPASGGRADAQSPPAASGADDDDDSRKPTTESPEPTTGDSERSSQRPPVSAPDDDDDGDDTVGRSPSDSGSPSSAEKAARRESQSPVATHAKDLTKAFTDAAGSTRERSNSGKKPALDGLSVDIPHSPAAARRSLQALDAVVSQPAAAAEKDRVSDGEDGDDEGPGGSATPTLRRRVSTGTTPRASDADEHKAKASRASKPKKKKKRVKSAPETPVDALDGDDESGETVVREEAKWVQCDSCKKWRTVPKAVDLDAMPERWYCKMNTWDAAFASCGVAEEVVVGIEAKKPKHSSSKRSKVKAKAPAKTPVAADAQTNASVSDGGASSPSSGAGSYTSKTPVASDAVVDDHGAGATASSGGDKNSKLAKKQEKHAKKRKLKLKLKEKYREVKWVQCESAACGKWRVVPSSVDVGQLPAVWTCELNTWSPELATCAAPNPPDVEAFLSKSHSKKSSSSSGASRPSKKLKASSESAGAAASDASAASGAALASGANGSDHPPPVTTTATKSAKPAKAPKGGVNPPHASTAPHASASASSNNADASGSSSSAAATHSTNAGTSGSSGGLTGATGPAGTSATTGASASSSTGGSGSSKGRKVKPDGIKKTVLEWAQCEKCNKWRKLPQHIKSSTLPDKWYCTMNHWDPSRASCAMPEEVDQEPLSASPLPSSQNWYPMPGHVTGASNVRSKRSKLSYSELLYASTGQLRKTYTSESSTHTFELDGRVYRRDDQYKDSSMYVSPDALVRTTTSSSSSSSKQATPLPTTSNDAKSAADTVETDKAAIARLLAANPLSVEQVATLVLDAMDLRRSSTVAELYHAASSAPRTGECSSVPLSLALVAAAVHHLVQRGLLEALERSDVESDEPTADDHDSARVGSKRRKSTDALFTSAALSSPSKALQYRKVPKRPLKASKCWKLGHSAFEFPLKE